MSGPVDAAIAQATTRDTHAVAGAGTIAASLALLVGWIVLLQLASRGPTLGWSLAHAVLFLGIALFIPAVLRMGCRLRAAQAREGRVAVRLVLVGALTLGGQYAIDLAVGQLASDTAEMSDLLGRVAAAPALAIAFYMVGPAGLYVGLGMLALGLRASRRIPTWAAGFAVLGVIGAGVGRILGSGAVTLLGHAVLCAGLLPTGWIMLKGSHHQGAPDY